MAVGPAGFYPGENRIGAAPAAPDGNRHAPCSAPAMTQFLPGSRTRARHALVLMAAVVTAGAAGGCHFPFIVGSIVAASEGSGYYWKQQPGGPYHAAEAGRRVRLVPVRYRQRGNIASGGGEALVEACDSAAGDVVAGELPCWPRDGRGVSNRLIERIDQELPAHRTTHRLKFVAGSINREVGTFRTAYVIGTRPLVIAFLDEAPDADAYRKLAGPQPWPPPEGTRGVSVLRWPDGNISDIADYRKREPRLVAEADLAAEVNVVLLYPDEMDLETANRIVLHEPGIHLRARLIVLPRRAGLSTLIDGAADPESLERQAQRVVEVPVRSSGP